MITILTKKHSFIKSRGFTLIELLMVIAIIGILTGVVIRMSSNSKTKAINSNIQSSLSQLATLAADVDKLSAGGSGNGNCDILFADSEMHRLITFAADQAGREVVYTYCSKSTADYRFAFIAPKVGTDGDYYCVDQNSGVREVAYSNINSILSDYSCSSVAAEAEEPKKPLTIISAVYTGSSVALTFNQGVWYEEAGIAGSAPVSISNNTGQTNTPTDNMSGQPMPYLSGGETVSFSFSNPILCTVTSNPWGSYSQDSHYLSINGVYGAESETAGSMFVSITCPAPTGSCAGSMTMSGCTGSDSSSCTSPYCTWAANSDACTGTPSVSCSTSYQEACGVGCRWIEEWGGYCAIDTDYVCAGRDVSQCAIPGCYMIYGQGGTCSQNSSYSSCSSFAGNDCPTQYGCYVVWQ